jgi:hypothetical protein
VDGQTLFLLRGISSYPANQRADDVAREIRTVARDAAVPLSALRVVDAGDRSSILAGERHILSVFDADARAELAEARHALAGFFEAAIARAIERYRHERSGEYLRAQAARAAVALAILLALLLALRRLSRWMGQAVERRVQSRFKALEARSFRLLSADEMRSAWQGGLRALHVLAAFVLILAGLDYVLSLFPWTRYAARRGTRLLVDPLTTMGNGVIDALPGLVFIAILVVITRYVLKLVRLFFSGVAQGRSDPRDSTRTGRGRPIGSSGW